MFLDPDPSHPPVDLPDDCLGAALATFLAAFPAFAGAAFAGAAVFPNLNKAVVFMVADFKRQIPEKINSTTSWRREWAYISYDRGLG